MTQDSQTLSASATYGDYASHEAILARIADIAHRFTAAAVDAIGGKERISPKQWELFSAVEDTGEAATLTYLGKLLGCSRQNVKKLALALEKQGLIALVSGHNNAIHIEITAHGYEVSARMKSRREALLSDMFEQVSAEDFRALCRALDAMMG